MKVGPRSPEITARAACSFPSLFVDDAKWHHKPSSTGRRRAQRALMRSTGRTRIISECSRGAGGPAPGGDSLPLKNGYLKNVTYRL